MSPVANRGALGVDLGTTNIRIHAKGKGIVLREPAVIAVAKDTREVKAVGREAYEMLGRTPGNIIAVRPMADGVIADYSLTEQMLKTFMRKVVTGPSRFFKRKVMVCVPSGITDVERRAVRQAMDNIDMSKTFLIEETIAGAIGAGIRIEEPVGSMVIDIGGGTTDIAVISLGGLVVSESIRVAGNAFDDDIIRYVRQKDNLLIGSRTAEEVKKRVGAAVIRDHDEIKSVDIKGRDLISGLPKTVTVDTEDVVEALAASLGKIGDGVRQVLESSPPELISDVIERGIVLIGGGATLRNIDRFLTNIADIPVGVAEEPNDCVVKGTSQALDLLHILQDSQAQDKLQYR